MRVAHLKVAAKELHSQLESVYYDQVFQCEMAVTARVSHPNLLHFHGAKLEGTRDDHSDRVHAHQPQS